MPPLGTSAFTEAEIHEVLMAVVARYPFAQAPGMGLNAYFAYTVVLGQKIPWETALGAVFVSGALDSLTV